MKKYKLPQLNTEKVHKNSGSPGLPLEIVQHEQSVTRKDYYTKKCNKEMVQFEKSETRKECNIKKVQYEKNTNCDS